MYKFFLLKVEWIDVHRIGGWKALVMDRKRDKCVTCTERQQRNETKQSYKIKKDQRHCIQLNKTGE